MRVCSVALLDQYNAALAEAQAGHLARARLAGYDSEISETSEPVHRIACYWLHAAEHPSAVRCVHLRSPAPMFGHANLPGKLWCARCAERAPRPLRSCSLCRVEADYLQEGEVLISGIARVTYELCRACDA